MKSALTPSWEEFAAWTPAQVAAWVAACRFPRLGIYVPDGTRRLTLALTDETPGTPGFDQAALTLAEGLLRQQLQRCFASGLWGLVVPLFSRRVLSRGDEYCRHFVLPALQRLTGAEDWLAFYQEQGVRLRFYGTAVLESSPRWDEICSEMAAVQTATASQTEHLLLIGVGGSPLLGEDAIALTGAAEPLERKVQALYGEPLPPADFVLIGGKMGGLGALPSLLCDGDTALYLMPVPGLLLSETGWRRILYDLLFQRRETEYRALSADERRALRELYQQGAGLIYGLGQPRWGLWLPQELYAAVTTAGKRTGRRGSE